jgi:glycerol-1-phosphate dehydrogenase [NAD(P)+]
VSPKRSQGPAPRGGTRTAQIPATLVFAYSDRETARALADTLDRLAVGRPLFVFGTESRGVIGRGLTIDCHARSPVAALEVPGASMRATVAVRKAIAAGNHDAVIGCGGGQTLDVAKYSASRSGIPFISLPTQATHDGICSPVAVLRDRVGGRVSSHGALPPAAVVVPIHVVSGAPRRTIVAGMADLASNLIAVEDWIWACQVGCDHFDDYAALLARSSAHLVVSRREAFSPQADFTEEEVEGLVQGLVLSGLAMTLAGSSRPCSGPEHLVSHAFDRLGVGSGVHGEQVAVGSVLAVRLFDADLTAVVELLERIGAPTRPADLGIDDDELMEALELVPHVRPERHTRLSSAMLADPDFIRELARSAWCMGEDRSNAPVPVTA